MAVTIKMNDTKELLQVTRNVAFDLIDRGLAERVYEKQAEKVKQEPTGYGKEDLSQNSSDRHIGYKNRQLHAKTNK